MTYTKPTLEELKEDLQYEKFHKFIMWGQEQNKKKGESKFWTSEIYNYFLNHFRLYILETQELNKDNPEKVLKELDNLFEQLDKDFHKSLWL